MHIVGASPQEEADDYNHDDRKADNDEAQGPDGDSFFFDMREHDCLVLDRELAVEGFDFVEQEEEAQEEEAEDPVEKIGEHQPEGGVPPQTLG